MGQRWEPARQANRRESSLSRVPAGPLRVSLPRVPQNSLSGQRPPPPLSQVSPPPPGGRGPGTSPYALVSLRFLCPFKSRCTVIKKGGAAAHPSPAGAEGMLAPQRARDAGPPVISAPGLAPSVLGRTATKLDPGTGSGFVQPAQQSVSTGRTRMSPCERLLKQHLSCLPLPLAGAAASLISKDKGRTGVVWEEGDRTAQSPSPTRSFSLSVQGK